MVQGPTPEQVKERDAAWRHLVACARRFVRCADEFPDDAAASAEHYEAFAQALEREQRTWDGTAPPAALTDNERAAGWAGLWSAVAETPEGPLALRVLVRPTPSPFRSDRTEWSAVVDHPELRAWPADVDRIEERAALMSVVNGCGVQGWLLVSLAVVERADADDTTGDCQGCGRSCGTEVGDLSRCKVCGKRVCVDCTNFPGDDQGPCVECEPGAAEAAR